MSYDNRFSYAVNIVLGHEGGYSDDLRDPGGCTNFGLTLNYLKDSKIYMNGHFPPTIEDIKTMTKAFAEQVYFMNWWKKFHFDEIEDLNLATKAFDLSVNIGPAEGIKLLQRAVNVADDGQIGPNTLEAVNHCEKPDDIMNSMRKGACAYYEKLVEERPALKCFLDGWISRAMW